MNEKLKQELLNFQEVTQHITNNLSVSNYDSLNDLFSIRQGIINNIETLSYEKEEFKEIVNELGIEEQDNQLKELLIKAKENVRHNINTLSEHWNAKNEYTKQFNVDSIFYNKKI